ncbi:MAG: TolB family protein [Phycisphaerales bacterium JB047]
MRITTLTIGAFCAFGAPALAQDAPINPNPSWDDQWATLESEYLSNYVQLTHSEQFIKAGESYFSPDGKMIIFQAIPVPPEGEKAEAHYAMYVAGVQRDDQGHITGLGPAGMVSAPSSANTCGWFHPNEPMKILFGTTVTAPSGGEVAGYQRENSRYSWQFPVEMDIMAGTIKMRYDLSDEAKARAKAHEDAGDTNPPQLAMDDIISVPELTNAKPLWEREGYDAEGSWSPDGRFVLYTQLEPGTNNGDIWIYDTTDDSHTPLVTADGYDGGPFFSPDGNSICYRSDRRGDNLLQIFVSTLAFDDSGKVTGIEEELQLTDNEHVNWCPFYTPDGKYLLYATSEVSHGNYEIYAIDAKGTYEPEYTARLRITQARGFDGLPAFTSDGQWMIWTAQRGAAPEGEKPGSQLWTASIDLDAIDRDYKAAQKKLTPND